MIFLNKNLIKYLQNLNDIKPNENYVNSKLELKKRFE